MDEQNTGGLQCMVWHNNNRAEEMSWSKEGKMSFSGCSEKYWYGLNTFSIQTYMFLRLCHFNKSISKGKDINCMKRQLWVTLCL